MQITPFARNPCQDKIGRNQDSFIFIFMLRYYPDAHEFNR